MHSVQRMEAAIALAQRIGWKVRYENLGEVGGGACEIAGQRWIFIDLALTPFEQFDQVIEALKSDAAIHNAVVPDCLREDLELWRRAA